MPLSIPFYSLIVRSETNFLIWGLSTQKSIFLTTIKYLIHWFLHHTLCLTLLRIKIKKTWPLSATEFPTTNCFPLFLSLLCIDTVSSNHYSLFLKQFFSVLFLFLSSFSLNAYLYLLTTSLQLSVGKFNFLIFTSFSTYQLWDTTFTITKY